jgi:hypothetical protein
MYTREQLEESESNPGMHHVSVVDGVVWMSEDALEDIELFTGRLPASDNLRDVLEFLKVEAEKLQGPTFSSEAQEMNWSGYCLMRGLRHAVETKALGREMVGEMPDPYQLHESFIRGPFDKGAFKLH